MMASKLDSVRLFEAAEASAPCRDEEQAAMAMAAERMLRMYIAIYGGRKSVGG